MSKSVGIVAEYNPFHTGHRYQIEYLKSKGFKYIAVAMSGACVQRGEFALMSKFARAEMAIENGASLVAEIPYPFSSKSAEGFALAGIETLKAIGVDALSFGSECGNEQLLYSIAEYLLSEDYEEKLKTFLNEKIPFAKAREKAIFSHFDIDKNVVTARNDILAIEYLKACIKLDWHPEIVVVKRQGANYNDTLEKGGFSSASGIRKAIAENRFDYIEKFIPTESHKIFEKNYYRGAYFLPDDISFQKTVLYVLRQKGFDDFIKIEDCNEELGHAFERALLTADSMDSLFEGLPTKRYTRARLNRIILSSLIPLQNDMPENIQYIRILGIRKDSEDYLREVGAKCPLPISHSSKILSEKSEMCKKIASTEALACDVQSTFFKISGNARTDFTTKFIKI